ncbi:holo-ACP synthase [Undibacterium arcticum]
MIYGIGTDIIKIARIEAALARNGERFAQKILGPQEMEKNTCSARPRSKRADCAFWLPVSLPRKRFSKAIGLGMRMPMHWRAMQTLNAPGGRPVVVTSGALEEFMQENKLKAQVSITDEEEYAVAFVIVEKNRSSRLIGAMMGAGKNREY